MGDPPPLVHKFAGPSAQGVLDPQLSAFVRSFLSLLASAKSLGEAQTPRVLAPSPPRRHPVATSRPVRGIYGGLPRGLRGAWGDPRNPKDPPWNPQGVPRDLQGHPGTSIRDLLATSKSSLLESMSLLASPMFGNTTKTNGFFNVFSIALKRPRDLPSDPRDPLGTPMGSPGAPWGAPRSPGTTRGPLGTPQGPPRDPPRTPKDTPQSAQGHLQ